MSGALVLFDVDGTLLLTHDEVYVEANRDALRDVWGIAPDGTDVPGQTALFFYVLHDGKHTARIDPYRRCIPSGAAAETPDTVGEDCRDETT